MTQCNCKNTDELRIVRGNAFAIRLTVSAVHIDGTPVENFVLSDAEAVLKVMHLDEKKSKDFLIIGNDAIINFGGDLSLGWYGFEMTGEFGGKPWRWCVNQVFQVVETNAKANIPAWAVLTDDTYTMEGVMTITSGDIYQSDWDETDPQSPSYIKNKPDVVLHPEFNQTVQRIDHDIAAEETRAKGAEHDLATAIGNEETRAKGAEQTLQEHIDTEALARGNADTTLQGNIDAEERDRKAADVVLQQNIDAEALARGNADTTLQGNIDAEETRAKAAEKQNADDIDAIEEKIPTQASAQNQLADKNFVNSSIATSTATYRGAYNEVSDLSLTTAATEQQIAAALATKMAALSITPDNNDYCFVQIPTADATPTQIARVDRYKYNGTAWSFEFSLNNSGFTAAQWAALNSGITSGLVTKLSDLPTNSELTTLLNGKQDTINDLHTIREGAAAGATAYQKPSGGIPKNDLAQGVQDSLERADEAVVADGAGTSGQVLTSKGSGAEPKWQTGELVHPVTNVSGTPAVTTASHYYSVKWAGQCEGVTALRDGMMINIKVPVQGNATYHTVLNINGLGEHPVCRNVTNEADAYVADSVITLIYDANAQAPAYFDSDTATTVTGVWKIGDYDSQIIYQLRHASNSGTYIAATDLPEGVICLQKNKTTLLPINATGGTGTSKVLTTESFNPFGAIVCVKNSYSANANISSHQIYEQLLFDLRISFNTGSTLTSNKDVYICAVPQSDGMAKLDATTPIVQDLPSTEDGKIYIYIGHIGSASKFELHPVHPVYWFKGGKIVPYTVLDISAKADKVSGATNGNLAGLDANGNLTDSGKNPSDFATAAQVTQIEQDIDNLEALVPNQASAQNQLADKEFVNSSISTATATYRGAYNEVSDLSLTTAATEQQIAAALATKMAALSITPDNNDYCFVQIPTADATPTQIARVDRYKYNGTAWSFEFSLNNSGFTAAQWAALNSGITSGLVTKLSDLPTNSELTTLLGGKADKSTTVTNVSFNSSTNKIQQTINGQTTDVCSIAQGGYQIIENNTTGIDELTPVGGATITDDNTNGLDILTF